MKKIWSLLLLSLILVLGACGTDSEENDDKEQTSGAADEEEANTDKEKESEKENDENESEDVQEDDDAKVTNTYTNKELGITGTAGSMEYEINAIQLKKVEPKNEALANLFEVEVGDEVHTITIEMAGENTSEEDMNFYLGQATIVTNTKEQLEPNMLLSEHLKGEYLGEVRHEGYNAYVLKNSDVDELETVEIRISAPMDSNFDRVGEDIKHTIEVN